LKYNLYYSPGDLKSTGEGERRKIILESTGEDATKAIISHDTQKVNI